MKGIAVMNCGHLVTGVVVVELVNWNCSACLGHKSSASSAMRTDWAALAKETRST